MYNNDMECILSADTRNIHSTHTSHLRISLTCEHTRRMLWHWEIAQKIAGQSDYFVIVKSIPSKPTHTEREREDGNRQKQENVISQAVCCLLLLLFCTDILARCLYIRLSAALFMIPSKQTNDDNSKRQAQKMEMPDNKI